MCLSYSNFHSFEDNCCKATWSQTELPLAFHGKDNWEWLVESERFMILEQKNRGWSAWNPAPMSFKRQFQDFESLLQRMFLTSLISSAISAYDMRNAFSTMRRKMLTTQKATDPIDPQIEMIGLFIWFPLTIEAPIIMIVKMMVKMTPMTKMIFANVLIEPLDVVLISI